MAIASELAKPITRMAGPAAREVTVVRKAWRFMPMVYFAAGMAASFIPVVGGGIAHMFDRMKANSDASYELNMRAKVLKNQIGTTLGMDPERVRGGDLLKAAEINPALRRTVDEVRNKQKAENRSSMLVNGGVTAAGFVGMGGVAKIAAEASTGAKMLHGGVQTAKVMAGALTGGAVAGLLNKNEITSQELLEAAQNDLARARAQGLPGQAAINPQMIFMVRVAQDAVLNKEINALAKKNFGGKLFHQLNTEQMSAIMDQYPALADATLNEARAIVNGSMPLMDLAGTMPNLGGQAGAMARADNRGSFVGKEMARRAANNNEPAAANDDGFVARENERRAKAAAAVMQQG